MKKSRLITLVVLLTAFFTLSTLPSMAKVQDVNENDDPFASALVTYTDVTYWYQNDFLYPWTVVDNTIKNGNCGSKNSASILTFSFYSSYQTELTFDWLSYNYSSHQPLSFSIDGVLTATTSKSSYTTQRYYFSPGVHVLVFKDSIGNSTSTSNYSYIKNLRIKEIKPLETAVLTENSQPLIFTNDETWPWTIEDGYIQNSNYGKPNTVSRFSTTFTIEKTSKFKYEIAISASSSNNNVLNVYLNGKLWDYWTAQRDWTEHVIGLEPGTYTVEWEDTLTNTTSVYYTKIRNIELNNNWVNVELATAGTLGYEVLYSDGVDVLTDVELLKVTGPMNEADWTDIKNMTNLIALDLSEAQITSIPNNAFDGKSRINNVILPESITSIGKYAFRGTNIRRIAIPSAVSTIGVYAFYNTPIQTVTFADNSQIQSIENYAFSGCTSLRDVYFGENSTLKTLGFRAYYGCTSLSEVILPNTVTSIGIESFRGCTALTKLRFSDAMTSISRFACYGCSSLVDLHLPNDLKTIYNESFYGTTKLEKVNFPSTLNSIQYRAFYNCGIDSLKLPITLQNLGNESFSNCTNLKYIELPSYLNSSSHTTYYNYYVDGESYYNGSSRTSYYGYRNNFSNCPAIEKIVMRSATPPTIDADPFNGARAKSDIILIVPSFAVVSYKLDSYWYQFGTIIEGDDVDYWKITSPLMLTNNRRMQGTPDVDLYYGGQLTVGGNAPFTMGQFNMYVNESNPGRLLNTCENMSANQATTKFSVDANKWYFFTPMHDVTVADIQVSNSASYVFRYYDALNRATNGASGSWKNVDTDKLLAGQGYIFHCNTACTITFPADAEGQQQLFRTDDVSRILAVNEATTTANRSWNYVGNPYPCYYDIYYMDFTAPITVWTGSTYKAYSVADDELVLRPMQSFFVQKPDAVDEIVFHKEGRQVTTSIAHAAARDFNRAAVTGNRYVFNLAIQHNELQDETRVVINDEAKMGYELERDAAKFMSFDTSVPQLFTLDADGNNYAINERPLENGLVRLAYYAGQDGFYTIRALRADGEVTLFDAELNKTVDITNEDYSFQSDATGGVNSSRFTLTFKTSGEATSISEELRVKSEESASAPVYNLKGQHVGQPQKGVFIQNGKKVVK